MGSVRADVDDEGVGVGEIGGECRRRNRGEGGGEGRCQGHVGDGRGQLSDGSETGGDNGWMWTAVSGGNSVGKALDVVLDDGDGGLAAVSDGAEEIHGQCLLLSRAEHEY